MVKHDVILPAGGRLEGDFAREAGTPFKALIELGGDTILDRIIQELRASHHVGRIAVIGPPEVLERATEADVHVPEGATGPENIYLGLENLAVAPTAAQRLLVVTTDLPFLTRSAIEIFLEKAPLDKDILVPVISRTEWRDRFGEAPALFVRLGDGEWTTGCAYSMSVRGLRQARPHIERVFENRKSKLGMARLLGLGFVLKWLTKRLTIEDVERKIQGVLQLEGSAVFGCPPELAFDIDYPDDLHGARRIVEAAGQKMS